MQAIQDLRTALSTIQDAVTRIEAALLVKNLDKPLFVASDDESTEEAPPTKKSKPNPKAKMDPPVKVKVQPPPKAKVDPPPKAKVNPPPQTHDISPEKKSALGLDDHTKWKLLPYLDDPSQSSEKWDKMLAIAGPENKDMLKNLVNNYKAALRRNPNVLPHQGLRDTFGNV